MKYIPYYRVSTSRQGHSRLGLEAQEHAISQYLAKQPDAEVLTSYCEVESGKVRERPELNKALAHCQKEGATLVVAKLDRLARDSAFVLSLRDTGVEFICCDFPHANRLTIGILACIAEYEGELISKRTKEGLAAAKRRGVKLGAKNPLIGAAKGRAVRLAKLKLYPATVLPIIREIQAAAVTSNNGIARCLNARGLKTIYGRRYRAQSVKDLLMKG